MLGSGVVIGENHAVPAYSRLTMEADVGREQRDAAGDDDDFDGGEAASVTIARHGMLIVNARACADECDRDSVESCTCWKRRLGEAVHFDRK